MELAIRTIRKLPFSYFETVNRLMPKQAKSLLDLGTGKGELGSYLKKKMNLYIHGIDIFKPYVQKIVKAGTYDKIETGNILKLSNKLPKYDVVLCSQVLEHLHKNEAIIAITKWEKLANMALIVGVPHGKNEQEAYDNNEHQKHHSHWSVQDLESLGFQVYGQGSGWLYTFKSTKTVMKVFQSIIAPFSYLLNFYYYNHPSAAAHLIAIKYCNEK